MTNFLKKNLTIRKGFVFGVILLVLFNILFISGYYRLFLEKRVNERYLELNMALEKDLEEIEKYIKTGQETDAYLKEYAQKEDITITITDEQNNVVEIYEKEHKRNNIIVSKIINIKDEYYLITLSKRRSVINLGIALDFLLFEVANIIFLAFLGIFMSNMKILSPITALSKDFNNYKLGLIPHKRQIKGEIDNLQNDFVDLVMDLEEEKQKQNRIIASISHDIKTPLTSILGYSQRLFTNKTLSDETKTKYASTIYSKSLVMKEIVEEFDDYLSCNIKDEKKTEKISIKYIVEYLNQYYKEDLKEKGIEFRIKTNCQNAIIAIDLAKFKRIFSNVITNSIRHFDKEKKGLNININEQKDDTIIFEIADNGSGCKEDLNKIFEPLYTTDKSRKISGLGLSICKEIVESHGGEIKAINNKMGGLSIVFTIPKYKEE